MGGSSDDGGGYQYVPPAQPYPNVPIAGQGGGGGGGGGSDPFNYGKYQNFLPNPDGSGVMQSAGGLTPDMFTYRSPSSEISNPGVPYTAPVAPLPTGREYFNGGMANHYRNELARMRGQPAQAPAPAAPQQQAPPPMAAPETPSWMTLDMLK